MGIFDFGNMNLTSKFMSRFKRELLNKIYYNGSPEK